MLKLVGIELCDNSRQHLITPLPLLYIEVVCCEFLLHVAIVTMNVYCLAQPA